MLKQIQPMLDRSDGRILAPLGRADQRKFMEMLTQLVHVNNLYSRAPLKSELREGLVARAKAGRPRRKT